MDDGRDERDASALLPVLLRRREAMTALGALGALGPLVLFGCGDADAAGGADAGSPGSSGSGGDGATTGGDGAPNADTGALADAPAETGSCAEIPDETGGPYPDVDGMIASTRYQRSDITEGLAGTPLSLVLQVVDVSKGCTPIAGAQVIIWHCDANGVYSEYASSMNSNAAQNDVGSTTTTYLRGWQETDANGNVTFTTIFPGWYTPRVTHIHVMVYNPGDLTTPVKTTQFTFPDSVITTVYAQTSLYPKGQNQTTVSTDMVFAGADDRLVAAITGSAAGGYAASLPIGLTRY